MSYPKNPNVRIRKIGTEFDWARITEDVHARLPVVETLVTRFRSEHPLWGVQVSTGTFPPTISLCFYLKPEAYPRRKTTWDDVAWPERIAVIPEDDMVTVAMFMVEVLRACPDLKSKLDRFDDALDYELKMAQLEKYRRRV